MLWQSLSLACSSKEEDFIFSHRYPMHFQILGERDIVIF
jgi:hypothetical protein